MKDEELEIREVSEDQTKALIRDYHIVIHLENRVILHDCADWSRELPSKRLCKHLGKLQLSLEEEMAVKTLGRVYANKKVWQFKPYTE